MLGEVLLLLRYRGIIRYASPLFLFSRVMLLAALGALFASFFYNLVSPMQRCIISIR